MSGPISNEVEREGWFLTTRTKEDPLRPLVDSRGVPFVFTNQQEAMNSCTMHDGRVWWTMDGKKAVCLEDLGVGGETSQDMWKRVPANVGLVLTWLSSFGKNNKVSVFEQTGTSRLCKVKGNWNVSSRDGVVEAITPTSWASQVSIVVREFKSGLSVSVHEQVEGIHRNLGQDYFWTLPEAIAKASSIMEMFGTLRTSRAFDRAVAGCFPPTVLTESSEEMWKELLIEAGYWPWAPTNPAMTLVVDAAYLAAASARGDSKKRMARDLWNEARKDASRPARADWCHPEACDGSWQWNSPAGWNWSWPKVTESAFDDLESFPGLVTPAECFQEPEPDTINHELLADWSVAERPGVPKRHVDRINTILSEAGYSSRLINQDDGSVLVEASPGEGSTVRKLAKQLGLQVVREATSGRVMKFIWGHAALALPKITCEYTIAMMPGSQIIRESNNISDLAYKKGVFVIDVVTGMLVMDSGRSISK